MKPIQLLSTSIVALCAATVVLADERPAALIIAQGGLGDASWNDTANAGFQSGLEKTGITGRPIESPDVVAQGEEIMRRAAELMINEILQAAPQTRLTASANHDNHRSQSLIRALGFVEDGQREVISTPLQRQVKLHCFRLHCFRRP